MRPSRSSFPLGIGLINTRGRQIAERFEQMEALWDDDEDDADKMAFLREGGELRMVLAGAIHGDVDPNDLNEAAFRDWQERARGTVSYYFALGRMAESGMTPEQISEAIGRREVLGSRTRRVALADFRCEFARFALDHRHSDRLVEELGRAQTLVN